MLDKKINLLHTKRAMMTSTIIGTISRRPLDGGILIPRTRRGTLRSLGAGQFFYGVTL